ncbi:hypothetical protein, partial [Streptomyces fagopyri]|uniref:hypothetical protein n=1 Tax=Streptomyces fagopyri TaxID=2662397 RepID=UPI0033E8FD3F
MPDDHIRQTKEPVPRSRSGVIGNRSSRAGTEPSNAESPLRLRLLLSGIFLPLFVAAAVVFSVWAATSDAGDTPGRGALLTFSDWLRGIWGEGQSGFGEVAVNELGVTL